MTTLTGILFIIAALIFSRPFTTLVHELGHALPALLFTKREVVIYIGSYGNIDRGWHFKLGRLHTIFTPKLLDLQLGLCMHQAAKGLFQSISIVLGGPIFSLLLGVVFSILIFKYQDQQYVAFVMAIFLVSGIFDFIGNIIPSKDPLVMHDGSVTLNDGAQLVQLIQTYNYPPVYFEALEDLHKENTDGAVDKFYQAAETGIMKGPLYQTAMSVFLHEENKAKYLPKAIDFHERYGHQFKLDSVDYAIAGDLYLETDNDMKAISHYNKAVELNYLNANALFSRAKLFLKLGYNERAQADLKKVLSMDESNVEARKLLG